MTCSSQPVWDLLTELQRWPQWWPHVSQVRLLHRAPVREAGTRAAFSWRSPVGYRFTIDVLNIRRERAADGHCEIEGQSSGDLLGQGFWVLDPVPCTSQAPAAQQVEVTYRYEVELGRRWMRVAAPLLRLLFKWSHSTVMEAGARGMAAQLHCRSSKPKHWTVVQPPITSSLPWVKQLLCMSRPRVVTFLSSMVSGAAPIRLGSVMTPTGAFTRSKIVPRFTAKASLRWPTNSLAGGLQPGILTV